MSLLQPGFHTRCEGADYRPAPEEMFQQPVQFGRDGRVLATLGGLAAEGAPTVTFAVCPRCKARFEVRPSGVLRFHHRFVSR